MSIPGAFVGRGAEYGAGASGSTHRDSIASLHGELIDELVRDQVRQVCDIGTRQIRLESLLKSAYRSLPNPNHLDTIKGIGEVTAAVLTAFILDIQHFDTPGKLAPTSASCPSTYPVASIAMAMPVGRNAM